MNNKISADIIAKLDGFKIVGAMDITEHHTDTHPHTVIPATHIFVSNDNGDVYRISINKAWSSVDKEYAFFQKPLDMNKVITADELYAMEKEFDTLSKKFNEISKKLEKLEEVDYSDDLLKDDKSDTDDYADDDCDTDDYDDDDMDLDFLE